MSLNTIAAKRVWFCIAPDGTEHEVVISVGIPTQAIGGEWRSVVSLNALDLTNHSIAGVDAWQAICLAMGFAATRASHFAEDGWVFYWERGGEAATPEDLATVP